MQAVDRQGFALLLVGVWLKREHSDARTCRRVLAGCLVCGGPSFWPHTQHKLRKLQNDLEASTFIPSGRVLVGIDFGSRCCFPVQDLVESWKKACYVGQAWDRIEASVGECCRSSVSSVWQKRALRRAACGIVNPSVYSNCWDGTPQGHYILFSVWFVIGCADGCVTFCIPD